MRRDSDGLSEEWRRRTKDGGEWRRLTERTVYEQCATVETHRVAPFSLDSSKIYFEAL